MSFEFSRSPHDRRMISQIQVTSNSDAIQTYAYPAGVDWLTCVK